MTVRHTTISLTVADYCQAYLRKDILVDPKYQRNAQVWPARVQSYLIETILRGFPIPKLALHQMTDVKSRRSIKYIVDGQQRTNALLSFFGGSLRLTQSLDLEDARGRTLDGLSPDLQTTFLSHQLQFDQFDAAAESVVREYFRRINSFTAPLNAEERRNAEFQGHMKWMILRLASRHTNTLVSLETLSDRQVIRMADHKLFSEIVDAMLVEVRTTDARKLSAMYRMYEHEGLSAEDEIVDAIDAAFDTILAWPLLRGAGLVKRTHIFYSLVLAVVAVQAQWATLQDINPDTIGKSIAADAERNLLRLEDVLESDPPDLYFRHFVKACTEKTNTWDQREARIKWLADAICGRSD